MEVHTKEEADALFELLQFRLEQLEAMACYFNQADFEILLDALDIMSREAMRHTGVTH